MKSTNDENKMLKSVESGEWTSVKNLRQYKKHLRETARKTLLKDQRMNIRIAKRDLDKLKAKAMQEGMPYQTLVSSILHKFIYGSLVEKG